MPDPRPWLFGLLLALPWLDPFASGPTPSVPPMLFSLACGAGLLLAWPAAHRADGRAALARAAAWAWLAAAAVNAAVGLIQYAGAVPQGAPGIAPAELGLAFGNLRQRNQLATLMAIGLASLAYLAGGRRLAAAPAWTLFALFVTAAAATTSRTGAAEVLLLTVLLFWWQRGGTAPSAAPLVRGLALALVPLYVALSWALPRLLAISTGHGPGLPTVFARMGEAVPECHSRLALWGNVLHLIELRPWTGWGWGELGHAQLMTPLPGIRFCEILDNAHNLPLQLAVELGLPVALLVCLAVLALVLRGRPWREAEGGRQLAWAVLAMIGLHSLLEYPLWYGPFQWAAIVAVALLWPARPVPGARAALAARAGVAVLLLGAVGFAAWDYHRVSQLYLPAEARDAALRDDTLAKVGDSRWFGAQVRFAELTTQAVTPQNAEHLHALAADSLHFSPEPRVLEKLLDSARALGRDAEVAMLRDRYAAAFPAAYARWVAAQAAGPGAATPEEDPEESSP